jgi:hypothetical protein
MLRKLSFCALIASALAGAFILGQVSKPSTASAAKLGRVFVARYGDVIQVPGAQTRCEASAEGTARNFACDHSPRAGRYTVVFYSDRLFVLHGPDTVAFSARWKP